MVAPELRGGLRAVHGVSRNVDRLLDRDAACRHLDSGSSSAGGMEGKNVAPSVPFAHLSGPNGAFVEFGITQYQFPDMTPSTGTAGDLNWVRVLFRVSDGERQWSRNDPTWETGELSDLAAWLRQLADGQAPLRPWDATEPLLTLVCKRVKPEVELIAELRLELQSDDAKMSNLDWDNPETVKLAPTQDEFLSAADVLDEALRRLPPRSVS